MSLVRTLPIRIEPLPGEALESWLTTLAFRSKVPPREIMIAVGLPSTLHGFSQGAYTTRLLPTEVESVSAATGIPVDRLHSMTLSVYDGTALELIPDRRVVNRGRLWALSTGSRFCPACLVESNGRWPLRWRLSWSVACTKHNVLLAHACPDCGTRPYAQLRRVAMHPPYECGTHLNGRGAKASYCTADLSRVEDLIHLAASSPVIAAQRWLDELLTGIERNRGASPRETLEDLSQLCAWLLRRAGPGDFLRYGQEIDDARAQYGNEWRYTPVDAAALAGPMTRAVELYQNLGGPESIGAISSLLDRDAKAIKYLGGSVINRRQRRSHRFQQTVWQAADSRMETGDRLRFRSCTPNPRLPLPDDPAVVARARSVPPLFWRDWTILLMPHLGYRDVRGMRTALSTALLLPGWARRTYRPVSALLHGQRNIEFSHFLAKISENGGRDALIALCLLADYLDTYPAPIDYQRRRTLDGAELLSEPDWIEICCHTNTSIGRQPRLESIRRLLYQRITGIDLLKADGALGVRSRTDGAHRLAAAPFFMSAPLLEALDQHALDYLKAHGIDEPVTWSPPMELVAGLELAGRSDIELDIDGTIQRFYLQHTAPAIAARELGTSLERMKLHFETQPPPTPWPHALMSRSKQNPGEPNRSTLSTHQQRRLADKLLTPEFLRHERLVNRKAVAAIARETGLSEPLVSRRLHEEGLQRKVRQRPIPPIDESWLKEQYLVRMRSMPNIAAELGIHSATLRTRLLEAGITPRQATRSLGQLPAEVLAAAPPLLIPALKRRIGLTRLRALRTVTEYKSVYQAARRTPGTSSTKFYAQIRALEADLGCKLYERTNRGASFILTPEGIAVLHALASLERKLPPRPR